MRCPLCSSLNPAILQQDAESMLYHESLPALLSSAKDGCEVCRLFVWNLQTDKWRSLDDDSNLEYPDESRPPLALRKIRDWLDSESYWLSCFYRDFVGKTHQVSNVSIKETPLVPLSRFSYRLNSARDWLLRCFDSHSKCSALKAVISADPGRPARLVEICIENGTVLCKLIECSFQKMDYVALSYRWGNSPHATMTTTENYSDRLLTIPFLDMPKTFREAIHLCYGLNCRYIWIDALCIIQPSPQTGDNLDWQAQSAVMGQIYANAMVTLAASSANASSEGLFPSKGIFETIPRPWFFPSSAGGGFVIEPEYPNWRQCIDNAPLQARAWVLQETLLSLRILHCTQYGIFWQCVELRAHECQPGDPYMGSKQLEVSPLQLGALSPSAKLTGAASTRIVTTYWQGLINEYVRRKIGVATDRLPALSALARRIALLTGDDFVAGLWKTVLLDQLAWYFDKKALAGAKSGSDEGLFQANRKAYIAPSWSWLSLSWSFSTMGNIHFLNPGINEQTATVEAIRICPVHEHNPYGQIKDGAHLLLRARMRYYTSIEANSDPLIHTSSENHNEVVEIQPTPNFDLEIYATYYILYLRIDWMNQKALYRALIVVPVDEKAKVYRRVGFLSSSNKELFRGALEQDVYLE